jgi:hypothetical protein
MKRLLISLTLFCLLAACAAPPAPPAIPPTPTAVPFTPIEQLPQGGAVITIGYLLIRDGAALIAPSASLVSPAPQPLGPIDQLIWCGPADQLRIIGALAADEGVQHAIVYARGTIEGGGAYGPGGAYQRQLASPELTVVAPEETSVSQLAAGGQRSGVVRLLGGMIINASGAATLVDSLGAGGVPEPGAQQIKLRLPAEDPGLLARLTHTPGSSVSYGQVQVEGYWRNGALVALAIRPLS